MASADRNANDTRDTRGQPPVGAEAANEATNCQPKLTPAPVAQTTPTNPRSNDMVAMLARFVQSPEETAALHEVVKQ